MHDSNSKVCYIAESLPKDLLHQLFHDEMFFYYYFLVPLMSEAFEFR